MLIATKIAKKNKLYIYSLIIMAMFGGGIFSIYQNYIDNLELIAPDISTPAISRANILDIYKKDVDKNLEEETATYQSSEAIDLKIFNDPKFRSLKKNAAIPINIDPGKRNPFEL